MSSDETGLDLLGGNDDGETVKAEGHDILERKKRDPTYGLTPAQKERYLKKLNAKPRPRDIFNVQEIVKAREKRMIDSQLR